MRAYSVLSGSRNLGKSIMNLLEGKNRNSVLSHRTGYGDREFYKAVGHLRTGSSTRSVTRLAR